MANTATYTWKQHWRLLLAVGVMILSPFQYGIDFGMIGGKNKNSENGGQCLACMHRAAGHGPISQGMSPIDFEHSIAD
jgi:hypothetical protein